MKRRLQNRIAESQATLPSAAILTTLLWWLPQGGYSSNYLHAWIAAAGLTYFVINGAVANALLRSRSQMVPALLLLLLTDSGFLHGDAPALEVTLALMLAIYCLMQTAPRSSSAEDIAAVHGIASTRHIRPQLSTFHAYASLALGSLVWPPLLLLALPLLWSQTIYLRSLTRRSFGAAIIGLTLPYFFWGATTLFMTSLQGIPLSLDIHTTASTDNPTPAFAESLTIPAFVGHCAAIIKPITTPLTLAIDGKLPMPTTYEQWMAPDWEGVKAKLQPWAMARLPRLSALALVALLALTGFIHYTRKSYDDKIRVRICHYTFLTVQSSAALWLALQPQHFRFLFPLFLLTTAPSAAHFITFTRTWLTNTWFVLLSLMLIGVGVINLKWGLWELYVL